MQSVQIDHNDYRQMRLLGSMGDVCTTLRQMVIAEAQQRRERTAAALEAARGRLHEALQAKFFGVMPPNTGSAMVDGALVRLGYAMHSPMEMARLEATVLMRESEHEHAVRTLEMLDVDAAGN